MLCIRQQNIVKIYSEPFSHFNIWFYITVNVAENESSVALSALPKRIMMQLKGRHANCHSLIALMRRRLTMKKIFVLVFAISFLAFANAAHIRSKRYLIIDVEGPVYKKPQGEPRQHHRSTDNPEVSKVFVGSDELRPKPISVLNSC